jgi:hypothetical protein
MTEEKTKPDVEFHAMGLIIRALKKLDAEAQQRVLNWLAAKFGKANG